MLIHFHQEYIYSEVIILSDLQLPLCPYRPYAYFTTSYNLESNGATVVLHYLWSILPL